MNIEVLSPYNRFLKREDTNLRVINVYGRTGDNISILVGLTRRGIHTNEYHRNQMIGSSEPIYKASIVVSVSYLGDMSLVKNRFGVDGSSDEGEIRLLIKDSLLSLGFTHLECSRIMTEFNKCVTEITDQPIVYTIDYPHGVTYRRHMMNEYNKHMVKKRVTRHRLI
jgi:hypothetical protein